MDLERALREDILPRVQKPSRYLGNEFNAVRKEIRPGDVRVALIFPDLYDVGLSNLGLLILYDILNRRDGVVAERAYAPGLDLEKLLRARELPLFSWETKTPLGEFDALGFSLQYELSMTNVLTILDLAGVPLRAEDRDERHPLVLAGGPCVCHPEPYALFFDAFVIGDGEEVVVTIADVLRELRGRPRAERLEALAGLRGVYVPALQPLVTGPNGEVLPDPSGPRVKKALLGNLDTAPYPTRTIVPFTQQVHDRVSLEVLRGCTHGCRFCQAGMTYRPVRERSLVTIEHLLAETIRLTGYDEVSLASLSTCDYSRVKHLVEQSVRQLAPEGATVALPSIRADSFSIDLAEMVAQGRKAGLTFAPEAATPRLRALIDKWLPDEELLELTDSVFARGWERVKLYFMIGLPTETDEDVEAIARLAREVLKRGRVQQRRAQVNVSVSTLVPKPFTPFQWERQIDHEETRRRQDILRKALNVRGINFRPHDAATSWLEGIVSRGDRRVGELFEHAWREGCRLDGWSEHFDFAKWRRALDRWGGSPERLLGERDPEAPLPWDHIDLLVSKDYLRAERAKSREQSLEAARTGDCRQGCHRCGVNEEDAEPCRRMLAECAAGARETEAWSLGRPPETIWQRPDSARVRFRFTKDPQLALLSHLELQTALIRVVRRAGVPAAYSQGYHPHLKLALGDALPVGMSSEGEYGDVRLRAPLAPDVFRERLAVACPDGIRITGACNVVVNAPSLTSKVAAASYRVELGRLGVSREETEAKVAAFLARDEVVIEKTVRKKNRDIVRQVEVRGLVRALAVAAPAAGGPAAGEVALHTTIGCRDGNLGRPKELLIALFGLDAEDLLRVGVHKLDSFVEFEGRLVSLGQGWAVPGRFDPYAAH